MIGALAHIHGALLEKRQKKTAAAQASAVLRVLRQREGRMLPRRELIRLLPSVPRAELSVRLQSLERAGLIVVDRDERPLLYGALPRRAA